MSSDNTSPEEKKHLYYLNNKDKWVVKDKEKTKEWHRQHYIKNKEKIKAATKFNASLRIDEIKEYKKKDCLKKSFKVRQWKKHGLIGDYDTIWKRYCNTTHCDICKVELTLEPKTTSTRKSMEHSHETGEFRNITCHKCNMARKGMYKNNNTGHKHIYKVNDGGRIRYRYKSKRYKTLEEAVSSKECSNKLIKS